MQRKGRSCWKLLNLGTNSHFLVPRLRHCCYIMTWSGQPASQPAGWRLHSVQIAEFVSRKESNLMDNKGGLARSKRSGRRLLAIWFWSTFLVIMPTMYQSSSKERRARTRNAIVDQSQVKREFSSWIFLFSADLTSEQGNRLGVRNCLGTTKPP